MSMNTWRFPGIEPCAPAVAYLAAINADASQRQNEGRRPFDIGRCAVQSIQRSGGVRLLQLTACEAGAAITEAVARQAPAYRPVRVPQVAVAGPAKVLRRLRLRRSQQSCRPRTGLRRLVTRICAFFDIPSSCLWLRP